MNKYRFAALTVVTSAAALSLASCSAGVTSASSTPTASASLRTVSVTGLGSFPIPAGAKVLENITTGKSTVIFLGSVTPQAASAFYASELPREGYKINENGISTENKSTNLGILFNGRGYKGTVYAGSNLNGADLPSSAGGNLVGITLTKG